MLAVLVIVLVLIGHLRRTGIGRMIIGVRENEPAAAAVHGLADAGEAHRVRGRRVSSPDSAARSSAAR